MGHLHKTTEVETDLHQHIAMLLRKNNTNIFQVQLQVQHNCTTFGTFARVCRPFVVRSRI